MNTQENMCCVCETCDKKINMEKDKYQHNDEFNYYLCVDCIPSYGVDYESDRPDEFEGQVSNSRLLEIFGDDIVYNKLKKLAEQPDLSSHLRVVWSLKMRSELWMYVFINDEPFYEGCYDRNYSCDMFYMLDELKKEQEEEENKKTCESCDKKINVEKDEYEYDDDTGFYLCGDCMPESEEEEKIMKTCCDCSKNVIIDNICRISKNPEVWRCLDCNYQKIKMENGGWDSDEETV